MYRILLTLESEELLPALQYHLQIDYEVYICPPADIQAELRCRQYDVLILDLYLQDTDGLTVLKNIQDCKPPIVLMLTPFISPFIMQTAADLGVSFVTRIPFHVLSIINHLKDLIRDQDALRSRDDQVIVNVHLSKLGLSPKLVGFRLLRIGIPLFAHNPHQSIFKELYPAISKITGYSISSIERSIRNVIDAAWENRNPVVWKAYFPTCEKRPTNKEFIATLAELLK